MAKTLTLWEQVISSILPIGINDACSLPFKFMFDKNKFMSFYRGTLSGYGASVCYDNIYVALEEQNLVTNFVLIGALATVRVEVGRLFLPVAENALFAIRYEFRKDLGNRKLGDGVKYRGRGYLQLTGRDNYEYYGRKLGVDLLNYPDLALNPLISAGILALYFKERGVDVACNHADWVRVRELVNGGMNGLVTFIDIINQYVKVAGNSNLNENNMQKLEITHISQEGDITKVQWHRFDTDSADHDSTGTWELEKLVTEEAINALVVARAKTMVDPGINVSLNLIAQ